MYLTPNSNILPLIESIKEDIYKLSIPKKDSRKMGAGVGRTMVFGYTRLRRKCGLHLSKNSEKYPVLYEKLNLLGKLLGIEYTSVLVNKNWECKPHKDNNKKNSLNVIFGFGDYIGGNLNHNGISYDIKDRFLIFDGFKSHYVEPFQNNRYTITFFTKK